MRNPIRHRIYCVLLAAMLGFVTGCASSGKTPTGTDYSADVATTDEVVTPVAYKSGRHCRMRRVTGSHIARQQCFSIQEKEDLEQASKTLLRTGGSRGGAYKIRSQSDPRDQ